MSEKEIDVIETTAGQITDVLKRLGVPKERMLTVVIEPEDWLTKARQESRRLVIGAGLSDDDIDRLIDQARSELNHRDEACCRYQCLNKRRSQGKLRPFHCRPLD
jgi:hypothetical protein